jgi:hypothetical protein
MYRKPTEKELAKIKRAREKTVQGIEGEKDFLSKISTTSAKAARDEYKAGRKMMEEVPEEARAYEAEMGSPNVGTYAKGGLVTSKGQGRVIRSKKTRIC